jgi:hypothetical protein
MDIIDRMKESIVKMFPGISDEELDSRLQIAVDLIKIELFKNYTYRKDKTTVN